MTDDPLALRKAERIEEIHAIRRLDRHDLYRRRFAALGQTWQGNPQATEKIMAFAIWALASKVSDAERYAFPSDIEYFDAFNVRRSMSADDFLDMVIEQAKMFNRVARRSRELKDLIAAAETLEAVNAIDTAAGWPTL